MKEWKRGKKSEREIEREKEKRRVKYGRNKFKAKDRRLEREMRDV